MESGGIVRRIDELGRIVIPKEMRKTLRLSVGDEMEIFSTKDCVMLKKYSGYESIKSIAEGVAKMLAAYTDSDVVIVNSSDVVIAEGKNKRHFQNSTLGGELLKCVSSRRSAVLHGDDLKNAFLDKDAECCYMVYEPITVGGDCIGGIAILLDCLPSDISRAYLKFCAELIEVSLR